MIIIAISFITGIAVSGFVTFFPVSIAVLCVSGGILFFMRMRNSKKTLLMIFIFVFGFLYSSIRQETFSEIKPTNREVSVEGDIINIPEMSKGKIKLILDRVLIEGKEIKGRVVLFLSPGSIINEGLQPQNGQRIYSAAKLGAPDVLHDPDVHTFDPKKNGVAAFGFTRKIHVVGKRINPWTWVQNRRYLLGNAIDRGLSPEDAALHKAIILGLTGGIPQRMRDAFGVTGLSHILSISGTHFGLLAFMIFKLIKTMVTFLPGKIFRRLTMNITPTNAAVLITMPVLIFYAFISGMGTPAVRSLVMISIYMLALLLGRRGQWLNSLAIAAVIILLYRPSELFDLSFQLSFTAVLSIGYVAEKRSKNRVQETEDRVQGLGIRGQEKENKHPIKKIFDKTTATILMTFAAVFGTAPVVALIFKQFPLISPVTNLIVTPLICFVVLPLGFFASFSAIIFNMSSLPFGGLIDPVTHFSLQLVSVSAEIPYANIHVPTPSFAIIALYYVSLIFMLKSPGRQIMKKIPPVIIICVYLITPYFQNSTSSITFLDVGQGDSAVVNLPDRKVMLIDGGTYEPDMGRAVIAPYLWSRGIRSIDYLVLTHPHPDHFGGLIYIIDNFRIGEVWLSGWGTAGSEKFFQKIIARNINIRVLRRGDVLEAEKYKIRVLHPYDEFFADSERGDFSNENSGSLVLKYESDDVSVLFTGDIETEAEETLLPLDKWLRSEIMKVPHHGGRTSSSSGFLEAVDPQVAVISLGENNPYGHPHAETIERLKAAEAEIYRTDIDGAVTITLNDYPISVSNAGSGLKPDPPYEIQTYWDTEFKKVATWRDEVKNLKLLF